MGNAVKFTDKGSIRVSVRCDASNGSGRMLLITVTDTGVGISPQEMEQLFQPFTQGDMSTTRRFGGTGLGLAISQRLARMLGGCIEVKSRVGHGSSFCVTVDPGPLENVAWISAAPVLQHRADAFKPSRPANLSGTVLLAEDALDVRSLIAAVLGQMGLTVETAANGREAIDRAIAAQQSGRPYDLILMDMQMPVCDGYQATRSLRDAGFPGQIVALTAHAMTGDRQKCLDAGCNDYLPKPIKSDELAAAVSRYLQIPYLPDSSPAATATASSGRPTGSLIDSKYFTPSARQKLLKGFIDGLPERIEKIQSALASRDVDSLIQTVHALHGTAGLYGYERMAKMALDVEEQARQGAAPTQVEALARDLLQICTETRLTFPEP